MDTENCNLAKIGKDLGKQWNEQGVAEWANRVGVSLTDAMAAAMKGMDDEANGWGWISPSLAVICKIAILQNCIPTSASSGTSRYLWIQIIAILQKFVTILPRARGRAEMPVRANWR